MAEFLGRVPPEYRLAVTKGFDRKFGIRRYDTDGVTEKPWNATVFCDVDRGSAGTTRVQATVTGSLAVIRIESSLADLIKTGNKWRVGMSEVGTPTLETPVVVGVFERRDGDIHDE